MSLLHVSRAAERQAGNFLGHCSSPLLPGPLVVWDAGKSDAEGLQHPWSNGVSIANAAV